MLVTPGIRPGVNNVCMAKRIVLQEVRQLVKLHASDVKHSF